MKKILLSSVIIVSIIAGIIGISISIMDFKGIYQEFARAAKIDMNGLEADNFKLIRLPVPHLIIDTIKQEGKVELKNVKIEFYLGSLFRFNPKIRQITINEGIIYLDNDDVNILNHNEFISELILKDIFSATMNIDKLTFIESDKDVALLIDNFKLSGTDNDINFTGTTSNLGSLKGSFEKFADKPDDVIFKMNFEDKNYSFNLSETYIKGLFKEGRGEYKTSNLSDKIGRLISDFGNLNSYFYPAEEVKINFNIEPLNQGLALNSIIINSPSLQGTGSSKISNDLAFNSYVNLEFSKMDLSEWLKPKKSETSTGITKYGINSKLDFSKSNMNINFIAKAVRINDSNILDILSLKAHIKDKKLEIEELKAIGDGGAKLTINGSMTQNSFRNIFDGKIMLAHSDLNDFAEFFGNRLLRTNSSVPFTFSSDVKSSSVDMSFSNFHIKTNNNDVSGNLSFKFIGNSPRTNANIKFTSLDVDKNDFPALSHAFGSVYNLLDGMKEATYLNKFIPIRKINSISNFDFTIDRLKLDKTLYENVNFNLSLSPGRVLIEQLHITDGTNWIDTDLSLEAGGIKPSINIDVKDGAVGVNFLSGPSMLVLKERILSNFDLSKIDITTNIFVRNLTQDNLSFGKVTLVAKNDKNLINISKFDADFLGGQLKSSGSILLYPYTINFVYALNSAQIEQINKLLPPNLINSNGLISVNGMVSTNGEKLDEQLYNLYIKSDIIGKAMVINNFSIDDFVQTLSNPNFNSATFKDDLNKALLTGQTKISDLQTGLELSKGMITLPSLAFKTKFSNGKGFVKFNLYDFSIEAMNEFAFYLANPQSRNGVSNYDATKINIGVKGNYFNPKKEATTLELEKAIKDRIKK